MGYGSGTCYSFCFHQLKLENELEVSIDNDSVIPSIKKAIERWADVVGFNDFDWEKVEVCTKDCAPSLGIMGLGSADKNSLAEAYDEYSDDEGVQVSGSGRPSVGGSASSTSGSKKPSDSSTGTPPPPPPTAPEPHILAAASKRRPRGSIAADPVFRKDQAPVVLKAGPGVRESGDQHVRESRKRSPGDSDQDVRESRKRGPGDRESTDIMRQQCPTCHAMRNECFREGDWACAHCGEHNGHLDQVCRRQKCGRPMKILGDASPEPDRPAKKQFISTWCRSCLKPKAECFKRLDWACPHCDNHNYARKQVWGAEVRCHRLPKPRLRFKHRAYVCRLETSVTRC